MNSRLMNKFIQKWFKQISTGVLWKYKAINRYSNRNTNKLKLKEDWSSVVERTMECN